MQYYKIKIEVGPLSKETIVAAREGEYKTELEKVMKLVEATMLNGFSLNLTIADAEK